MDGRSFAHYRQPHHYSCRRWCRDGQCCLLCWVQCSHHRAYFAYCLINIAKMSYKEAYFEVQIGLMNGQTNDVILPFGDLFTLEREEKRVCRPVNAFVERGSFKSSPRKLMVNFLNLA